MYNVRREPGRDGKILCDHRQDGNGGPSAISEIKEEKERKKMPTKNIDPSLRELLREA